MNVLRFPRPLLALAAFAFTLAPLSAQRGAPAPAIVAEPFRASGIYAGGEKAGWTISPAPGATPPAGDFTYTVKTNNAATIRTGAFNLSSGRATIEVVQNEPAMLYVQITPPPVAPVATPGASPEASALAPAAAPARGRGGRGGRNAGGLTLGAAVSPSKIGPAVSRPADFDAFWDGKLAELAKVPPEPVLVPEPAGVDGIELYTAKIASLGSSVRGYVAKPARTGKFPALIMYQWAGVYSLQQQTLASVKERAAEGWLVFNVNSHDIAPNEGQAEHPELAGYQSKGNADREACYFLAMYLRDARAVDYIKSRPDWDGKTIVLQGTSMGGQQSLAAAALRPADVTAVIINVPAGADSNGSLHGRAAGYPNWATNNPKVMETALYFDTVNFASRIKAPVVAAMGFIDTVSPPVGIWATLNQISGPKEAIAMVESDHNHITPEKQGAWNARSKEVRDALLRTGRFQPAPYPHP